VRDLALGLSDLGNEPQRWNFSNADHVCFSGADLQRKVGTLDRRLGDSQGDSGIAAGL